MGPTLIITEGFGKIAIGGKNKCGKRVDNRGDGPYHPRARIRPGFGRLGVVKGLPPEARQVESEAKVRVVEVELPDGEKVIVPRTNVEVVG